MDHLSYAQFESFSVDLKVMDLWVFDYCKGFSDWKYMYHNLWCISLYNTHYIVKSPPLNFQPIDQVQFISLAMISYEDNKFLNLFILVILLHYPDTPSKSIKFIQLNIFGKFLSEIVEIFFLYWNKIKDNQHFDSIPTLQISYFRNQPENNRFISNISLLTFEVASKLFSRILFQIPIQTLNRKQSLNVWFIQYEICLSQWFMGHED